MNKTNKGAKKGKKKRTKDEHLKAMLTSKIAALEMETIDDVLAADVSKEVAAQRAVVLQRMDDIEPANKYDVLLTLHLEQAKQLAIEKRKAAFWEKGHHEATTKNTTLRAQLEKTTSLKDRLENLCHELQKRNQAISEEVRKNASSQRDQHKALTDKFEGALGDIQLQIKTLGTENAELREKLAKLLQLQTSRETYFEQQLKTKVLETQLAQAQYKQQLQLSSTLQDNAHGLQLDLQAALKTEIEVRTQLKDYGGKFDEVQTALTKSNEMFVFFKKDLLRLKKENLALATDKADLDRRNHECQGQLVHMFDEQKQHKSIVDKLQRQKEQLRSLCKELTARNKANGNLKPTEELTQNPEPQEPQEPQEEPQETTDEPPQEPQQEQEEPREAATHKSENAEV